MIDPFRCNLALPLRECIEPLNLLGSSLNARKCLASQLCRTKVRWTGVATWPSSHIGWVISQQDPERHEWPDWNELLVHKVFLR
jgi:hypothetical protein